MGKRKSDYRPRLRGSLKKAYDNLVKVENRVMVVGDLHCPFDLEAYFDFIVNEYEKNNCNQIIFIGDVIDSHYSSYHEVSNEADGAGRELDYAIERLKRWYKRFPDAYVTLGNHDRIILRKAMSGGVAKRWIRDFNEVLETPNWKYVTDVWIDGVRYVHGDKSGKPRMAARRDMVSTVSGHFHTDMYCEWYFGKTRAIFSLAVGCGIDSSSYAMGYMQGGKKEAIGCGIVLGGEVAFNVRMPL